MTSPDWTTQPLTDLPAPATRDHAQSHARQGAGPSTEAPLRILAIFILGALAYLTRRYRWLVHSEPIIVDTSRNGGVSSTAVGARVRQR